MSDLRITGIEVDLVRWPLKMKRRHGVGDVERTMPGVIVKLVTDGGIAGWGEAAPWAVFTGTAEANALAIHHYLRPLLIGADPFDLTRLMAAADHALVGHGEAKAAIEMALFDIAGKRLGVPVAALLGGFYRAAVPLSVSIANPDFAEDLDFARRRVAEGVARHRRPARRLQSGAGAVGCDPPAPRDREFRAELHRAAGTARAACVAGGDRGGDRHADHGR